jgi:hypothetical protein
VPRQAQPSFLLDQPWVTLIEFTRAQRRRVTGSAAFDH